MLKVTYSNLWRNPVKNILLIAAMLFALIHVSPALASTTKAASGVAAASAASGVAATLATSSVAAASAASGVPSSSPIVPAPDWLTYVAVAFSMAFAILGIASALAILVHYNEFKTDDLGKTYKWRLALALSEEVEISDASDPAKKRTMFVASSSRLVAFVALIVLVALLVGVTPLIIWSYAKSGTMPQLDELSKFLIACAGLFLPYIANQARAAIEKKTP